MERNNRTIDSESEELKQFFNNFPSNGKKFVIDVSSICLSIWATNKAMAIMPFIVLYNTIRILRDNKNYKADIIESAMLPCDRIVADIINHINEQDKKDGNS